MIVHVFRGEISLEDSWKYFILRLERRKRGCRHCCDYGCRKLLPVVVRGKEERERYWTIRGWSGDKIQVFLFLGPRTRDMRSLRGWRRKRDRFRPRMASPRRGDRFSSRWSPLELSRMELERGRWSRFASFKDKIISPVPLRVKFALRVLNHDRFRSRA